MNTQTHSNTQDHSHQSAGQESSSPGATPIVDNRPETVAQRKLQDMANNSPQATQAAQMKTTANGSSTQPIQRAPLIGPINKVQNPFATDPEAMKKLGGRNQKLAVDETS